jgi:hypothetical protein
MTYAVNYVLRELGGGIVLLNLGMA